MANPYTGEIRMFAGNFAPFGWMFCEGQLLPIADYPDLFQLIGTTYGGDGATTFNLPDLRGRVPLSQASGFVIGDRSGSESVTLSTAQLPSHIHAEMANLNMGNSHSPVGGVPAESKGGLPQYAPTSPTVIAMHPQAVVPTGGSQPHPNMMPYLCLNYIIAMTGIFPSQT